ncbi:MAG: acetate kinase [Candidatus Cloacimonas sp.]|nr:acetate kinase [Candidatus Cloacimonadota bacterium]
MKILTINCGSSSIKFSFINTTEEIVLAEGIVERIGEDIGLFTYKSEKYTKKKRELLVENHEKGVQLILDTLMDPTHGIISDEKEIDGVGHRLVHGGEFYSDSVVIDRRVMDVLEKCTEFAPLHNPANIKGVEAVSKQLPNLIQCGVFDTAFHQTMPKHAFLYPLPLDFYTEKKIRRYGFHGTSHRYVAMKAAEHMGKGLEELKIITCHIGNGASITAINKGKSVDTSMGFTPLEGLMMGTRTGDLDPAILVIMMKQYGYSVDEVNNIINKRSGMLGLSQISNDMREIEEEITDKNNQSAIDAFEVYCYKIKKYIGSYIAAMNGLDILVFTGGVGENMALLREKVCSNMEFLNIEIDLEKNKQHDPEFMSMETEGSQVAIYKIATDEELMIALDTEKLLSKEK